MCCSVLRQLCIYVCVCVCVVFLFVFWAIAFSTSGVAYSLPIAFSHLNAEGTTNLKDIVYWMEGGASESLEKHTFSGFSQVCAVDVDNLLFEFESVGFFLYCC